MEDGTGAGQLQQLRIYKAPGIDHLVRLPQEPGPPEGDEVRRAAAGAHDMYHQSSSFTRMVAKYPASSSAWARSSQTRSVGRPQSRTIRAVWFPGRVSSS